MEGVNNDDQTNLPKIVEHYASAFNPKPSFKQVDVTDWKEGKIL